eukprot:CAMPEP_0206246346 /NCGR_PEP_ID=MMETSP0047_2-20121206/19203_1 /ASSEMBLY_ACC=CAM_ASM_000192 /TAXON_ID=195065 /ORGANISM="Chroomonas mesostigmatica_cf, Strain CCMP1168" /LENGTH=104 /DNA_ID=CAMNT_0053671749 /DNA_START=268 /DNA_END=579 /DNA_ORIENTATION=-
MNDMMSSLDAIRMESELSSEAFQPAMTPIVAAPVMIMADAALLPPFFCATVVNALATLGAIIFTDFSICLAGWRFLVCGWLPYARLCASMRWRGILALVVCVCQ